MFARILRKTLCEIRYERKQPPVIFASVCPVIAESILFLRFFGNAVVKRASFEFLMRADQKDLHHRGERKKPRQGCSCRCASVTSDRVVFVEVFL